MNQKKSAIKYFSLITLFLVLSNIILADSLISINDLSYHTKFEEAVFNNLCNDKEVDYFALFLCSDSSANQGTFDEYKTKFNSNIEVYSQSPYKGMKETKLVKKAYKEIHDKLLNQYVEQTNFSEVFTVGKYHCVSGSMLYALVFDEIGVPYEIKETPAHVYLTAYPDTHKITVETTSPVKGVAMFDNQFKNKYVNYLKDNKLITKDEYKDATVYELFDKYYLSPEVVDLKQLAGIQYYNNAISELREQNYVAAHKAMEKAYYLYPNKKQSFFLLFTLANAIDHVKVTNSEYADLAGKLCRFHGKSITSDQLIAIFGIITEKQLNNEGNTELYDESYQTIINEIRDTTLRDEISFIYNYERGRVLFNQSKYIDANPFLEKAYSLKQRNVDAENLFVGSIIIALESKSASGISWEELLNNFDEYAASYPNLKNIVKFESIRLSICLDLMDYNYLNNNVDKAEYFRIRFEQNYNTMDKNYPFVNNLIPRAYTTGAGYYFKRGNNKQAKKLVLRGLEYLPNNYQLKSRLNALN